jgi:signal peptidase I
VKRRKKILIGIAAVWGILVLFRLFGLLVPFVFPNQCMTPAISRGDHFLVEGFAYMARKPRRGDNVAFTARNMTSLRDGDTYVKRLVGLPGETLRISEGKLYVNDVPVEIRNKSGVIQYTNMPFSAFLNASNSAVVIPEGHYFVLGDNSPNSNDSRNYGFLPAKLVCGRMWFCYWPLKNVGAIK